MSPFPIPCSAAPDLIIWVTRWLHWESRICHQKYCKEWSRSYVYGRGRQQTALWPIHSRQMMCQGPFRQNSALATLRYETLFQMTCTAPFRLFWQPKRAAICSVPSIRAAHIQTADQLICISNKIFPTESASRQFMITSVHQRLFSSLLSSIALRL